MTSVTESTRTTDADLAFARTPEALHEFNMSRAQRLTGRMRGATRWEVVEYTRAGKIIAGQAADGSGALVWVPAVMKGR